MLILILFALAACAGIVLWNVLLYGALGWGVLKLTGAFNPED